MLEPWVAAPAREVQDDSHADALNLAGACALAAGAQADAQQYWLRAIEARPTFAQAHYNLGVLLHSRGRHGEAIDAFRSALGIRPDYREAHHNLCVVLKELGMLADAETACRQALAKHPNDAALHHDLGTILRAQDRFDDGEAAFRTALALAPEYPDAKAKLGALLLADGRFDEGWQLFEARHDARLSDRTAFAPEVRFAQWRGEPLLGKAVLVWQEQGLGDMLMFGRYIAMLKAYGAAWVTLACAPALHRLFGEVPELDAVVDANCALARAEHDFWTLPLSIPRYVGTTLESIPAAVYLTPPIDRIDKWRTRLGPASSPRIGLVWKGNPAHANDAHRSVGSLAELEPLLRLRGVRFVSLQKGAGEEEAWASQAKYALTHLGTQIEDFADSAAIISQLDLVICVDTAIAHLAGALGKSCWVMLPQHDTDWRWLRERSDSPWYPGTVRLFRQESAGDWAPTIEAVRRACIERFGV